MEKVILKVQTREATGKKVAKDLRNQGLIPAVVYRAGEKAISLQLAEGDMEAVLHTKAGENVLITLKIGGESKLKDKTVVVKEIQREPVKDKILHVDFNEISLTEMLKVNVPLVSKGECVGVKKDGGVLEHIIWELQVECLPTDIPEKIEADVTNLAIGQSILVKDIAIPAGVKVLNDPELIAFSVKQPKVEVVAPVEEAAAEAAAEPELIRKKKEEEAPEEESKKAEAPKEAKKEEK